MTSLLQWAWNLLKPLKPVENDASGRMLVEDLIKRLNEKLAGTADPKKTKNKEFMRRFHETVFSALKRKCEMPLWKKLIDLAEQSLGARRQEKHLPSRDKWTATEIGNELSIDKGTIGDVLKGKPRSISLTRLIVVLVKLEKQWAALGKLPDFNDLLQECYLCAIGCAQAAVNDLAHLPPPPTDRPTAEELAFLKAGFPDDKVPSTRTKIWNTWGLGWLITYHKLGLKRGLTNGN